MHAKTKRNFEIFSAEKFIAAIMQHIPDKGFQMVRYYGWYCVLSGNSVKQFPIGQISGRCD